MRDEFHLVRPKRDRCPQWLWHLGTKVDPRGVWLCHWLSRERTRSEMVAGE